MATLKGTTISETYPLLLKIASSGIDGTLRNVEDGDGTASALQISSSSVNINGGLTASGDVNFDSNTLFVDASANSVGINYSTPGSMEASANNLVIGSGASGDNTGLTIFSNSDSSGSIHFADGTSGDAAYRGIISYNQTSDYMRFFTAGSERMRIDSSGNVAIGATDPLGYGLNIESSNALRIKGADSSSNYHIRALDSASNVDFAVRGDGKVSIGHGTPSYTLHTTKAVAGDWLALFSNTSSSSGNGMLIDADSEILRLRDDVGNTKCQFFTDKTLLNAGNVGINVTSPEDKLHIAGTSASVSDTQLVLEGRYGGYGAGINFVSRTSSGGTNVSMAKITADGEAAFDTTAANQDAGLRFFTTLNGSSAEKMRITSDGDVLMGTTSLLANFGDGRTSLAIKGTGSADYATIQIGNYGTTGNDQSLGGIYFFDGSSENALIGGYRESSTGNANIRFYTSASGGSLSERMRITSAGNVLIGTTSTVTTGGEGVELRGDFGYFKTARNNTGNVGHWNIFNPNGEVGSVTTNGSSTSFNTSSDYRLKENEVLISDGLTRLNQLKPYRFNFIADTDTTVDGFFAHEVAEIVPEAVNGEKDAVDDEGNIKPQSIDQSKLVPLLVKALQEADDKIDALEARIEALEA